MSTLRASLRLVLLVVFNAVLIPVCLVAVLSASLFGPAARHRVVMTLTPVYCWLYLTAFGVIVRIEGRRDGRAKIFVGNHVSYLDIFIAGYATGGIFVSRHDVKDWPLIGWFARLAGTVFIDRSSLRSAIVSSHGIVERVDSGARITLFPEGGILPGPGVKAFKPFLLAAIAEEGHAVQPFAIVYRHADGRPVDAATRNRVEWHDSSLLAHAWGIMGMSSVRVTVRFVEPRRAVGSGSAVARQFAEDLRATVERTTA
jgi:1-acyl-sn-glycerol-3-phosphate acyltransferase